MIKRLDQPEGPVDEIGTDNQAPSFTALPSPEVTVGEQFLLTLTATDNDGTFPSVTVAGIPPGMRIRGLGNGQLELSWRVPETAAAQSLVELVAIDALDGSLRTLQPMVITVRGAHEETLPPVDLPLVPQQPDVSLNPPVFRRPEVQQVRAGDLLSLRIVADDADGIPPGLTISNPPADASFDDNGDGTRTFRWQVPADASGTHSFAFVARDHADPGLIDTLEVDILIVP